jgi:hypothetical protein
MHVDLLRVEPLAGLGCGQIRLVLVVGEDDLDGEAVDLAAEVLDGQLDRLDSAHAGQIGVQAVHVIEQADLDDAVGDLRCDLRGRALRLGDRADEAGRERQADGRGQCAQRQAAGRAPIELIPLHQAISNVGLVVESEKRSHPSIEPPTQPAVGQSRADDIA